MGKKKGSKKKDGKKAVPTIAAQKAGPSSLELALRLELEQLERDLQIAKTEAEVAREQNDVLMIELRQTEAENGEYEAYMTKKTVREQQKIDQLQQKSQAEIDQFEKDQGKRDKTFNQKKKDLLQAIHDREGELTRTQRQVADLHEIQEKRDQQQAEIARLEELIERMNLDHFEQLQELKSQYLKEKVDFQHSANTKVKRLEQRAHKEAVTCLTHHSHQVKQDNRYLKTTLLALINENKSLQASEEKLESQNAELRRQLELDARLSTRARGSPSRITITR